MYINGMLLCRLSADGYYLYWSFLSWFYITVSNRRGCFASICISMGSPQYGGKEVGATSTSEQT